MSWVRFDSDILRLLVVKYFEIAIRQEAEKLEKLIKTARAYEEKRDNQRD